MQENKAEELGGKQLSEKELDALYMYLDMYLDSMSEEDKKFWMEVVIKIDKEFYED